MKRIERILVAVDVASHPDDDPVLDTAARLAEWQGAALEAVTVVPDLGVGEVASYFPPDYEEKALAAAAEALSAHVTRLLGAERAAGVSCAVRSGSVYRAVLDLAEETGADLVVVGSHTPSAADFLLGSNASRIVRHARCSVYVVR